MKQTAVAHLKVLLDFQDNWRHLWIVFPLLNIVHKLSPMLLLIQSCLFSLNSVSLCRRVLRDLPFDIWMLVSEIGWCVVFCFCWVTRYHKPYDQTCYTYDFVSSHVWSLRFWKSVSNFKILPCNRPGTEADIARSIKCEQLQGIRTAILSLFWVFSVYICCLYWISVIIGLPSTLYLIAAAELSHCTSCADVTELPQGLLMLLSPSLWGA